jgi:hypothetical protein
MAVPPSTRRVVRERAQRHCEYCHADERWQFVRFTIDHVLPLQRRDLPRLSPHAAVDRSPPALSPGSPPRRQPLGPGPPPPWGHTLLGPRR